MVFEIWDDMQEISTATSILKYHGFRVHTFVNKVYERIEKYKGVVDRFRNISSLIIRICYRVLSWGGLQIVDCDILFINPPYQRREGSGTTIPLGLGYLASFLRLNGFKPVVLDCAIFFSSVNNQSLEKMRIWLLGRLSRIRPKLAIGIGPCTLSSVPSLIAIEQICRKLFPNVPIIYGGPLASTPGLEWFFFEYLHAFAVIPGDAEVVLTKLLTAFRSKLSKSVKGVFHDSSERFAPNIIGDLDILPFPARDLFRNNRYHPSIRRNLFVFPFATMICSRGCPHSCGFCLSSTIRNGVWTKRSLENISDEIKMLTKNIGARSIIFYDDSFFVNTSSVNEELTEFSKMVRDISENIVWQIEMRPDVACSLTEKTIRDMYRGGCRQINLGIEKATTKGLKSIGKNLNPDQSTEACKRIRKVAPELRLTGTFILGGPHEIHQEAIETIEFSKDLGLLFAHFYPMEIYPGTRLYQEKFGSDMRVWLERILQERTFLGSLIYEDCLDKKDLIDLVCEAYRVFYRRKEWIDLAKKLLGNHFADVRLAVSYWGERIRW